MVEKSFVLFYRSEFITKYTKNHFENEYGENEK